MKDLDFDELDRAVNSLIANGSNTNGNNVEKNTTIAENNLPKTPINSHFATSINPASITRSDPVTIPSLPSPIVETTFRPTNPISNQIDVHEIKPIPTIPIFAEPDIKPLASRRSSGRFMDVVHPSSDMRTTLIMPDRVSRQGTTIHLSPFVDHNIAAKPVVVEVPALKPPELIKAPEVVEPVEPVAMAWPDPIDLSEKVEIKLPVPVIDDDKESEDDDIDRISDDIDNTLNRAPEVQESPFLSGAKVTKRPLGAFSGDNSLEYIETNSTNEDIAAKETSELNENFGMKNVSGQIDTDIPLPAELMGDLLSIEAANEVEKPVPAVVQVSSATPVTVTAPPAPAAAQVTVAVAENDPPKVIPIAEGPTSISQQYQEKPSTGDQNSAAIYDTSAYHQAIVGKSNKKSHLFLIIWILSLLAVGAGAGAAIYFFVLPLL